MKDYVQRGPHKVYYLSSAVMTMYLLLDIATLHTMSYHMSNQSWMCNAAWVPILPVEFWLFWLLIRILYRFEGLYCGGDALRWTEVWDLSSLWRILHLSSHSGAAFPARCAGKFSAKECCTTITSEYVSPLCNWYQILVLVKKIGRRYWKCADEIASKIHQQILSGIIVYFVWCGS